jgi:hypothetical protein
VSLAATYEAARIVADRPPRILTLDIERLPGRATVQHRGLTITGDFWDLSGWKHTIGYRIPPSAVTEWPRTICLAWRWYGGKRVQFAAEWLEGGREQMLRTAWELFHEADYVIGHNLAGFDAKKLAGEWWADLHLSPPSPYKVVDTLKVARSRFSLESNQLDALLTRAGIQGKTDKYSVAVARAACEGDKAAQRKIRMYNQGDIEASDNLYMAVLPWIQGHPHIGLYTGDEDACGHCGGELKQSDWYRTAVTAYAQMHCQNCGAWYRKTHIKARVSSRAAR